MTHMIGLVRFDSSESISSFLSYKLEGTEQPLAK
jgi:hypothetical protein